MTIRGQAAEVRWVYHRAATLGPWTITGTDTALQVTATVQDADAYRVSQHPVTFVVPRGEKPAWTWAILPDTLQIVDGTLTASLSPQE